MNKRIRDRAEAERPYCETQYTVPASAIPVQFRVPGLKYLTLTFVNHARVASIYGQPYFIGRGYLETHAVYYDYSDYPGTNEASKFLIRKVSWSDEKSGFDCIILRSKDGIVQGFVGLPEGHRAHGLSCRELQATWGDPQFRDLTHGEGDTRRPEQRVSMAEEAQSVCNRLLATRRHSNSFGHVTRLLRDPRWWFGFASRGAPCLLPMSSDQLELPLSEACSPILDDEATALLEVIRLAEALRGIDPRRRDSEAFGASSPDAGQ